MTLEVRLAHDFGGFVLDAGFSAPGRGVTALFGPSGAGKSSIVLAIAGLLRPGQGRIQVGGRVLLDTAQGIFLAPAARRTGLVFQDSRLFPRMNVENNLLFGWRRAPVRADSGEIARVVAMLGLEKLLGRMPRHLSGGEKGRVALGRALLAAPDILLLDEPLAALDEERRGEILPYLERLRDMARVPILFVSHVVSDVARLADHVVVVRNGRVTVEGSVFDLLTEIGSSSGIGGMGAVLDTRLARHRPDGLSELAFDGGSLAVARLAGEPGQRVRVRIAAEDIMLAREEPRLISANNVLPVTVTDVRETDGQADIQLFCGGTRLVARITASSMKRLGLAPGAAGFAIIKSVTVDTARTNLDA